MTPDSTSAALLSVIIVNWNGARFLPRLFDSLRAQDLLDVQTILVDNGSTDESVRLAQENYAEVEIIELGGNLGYAEANNRAAALSRAKYLFFLNNDTYLPPDALAALVSTAEADPLTPILAPRMKTYDGTEFINMGIGLDVFGFPCGQDKIFYADGAAFFIQRDLFVALGGFDASYFMFFEETDLCWRAWLQGYRVGAAPTAVVFHMAGGTAGSSVAEGGRYSTRRSKRRLSHRNQIATLLKNYSTPALFVVLPLFAALTAAEVLLLLVSGQRAAVVEAYMPAWRDLLSKRAHIRAMRRRTQRSRCVSDYTMLRHMQWRSAMIDQFRQTGIPAVK